jgi:hypothetical protein
MVHRVYICSNLKFPFAVHQYDQSKGCIRYNHVMSRSPSFVIKNRLTFKKESNVGYYLQPALQRSSNRGRFVVKKGSMMRTWHLRIRTLITR